jgi:hypothetical protein
MSDKATSVLDWNSIGSQKGNGKKSDDLVFLTAKNLPKTFLPSQKVIEYESVFDSEMNRQRPPKADEKAKTQYLFYGLSLTDKGEKVIKIYSAGRMTAAGIGEAIKMFRESAKQFDSKIDPETLTTFVEVTSTGSGLGTEYKVKPVQVIEKPVPVTIWDKLKESVMKLPTLEEMRDRLLGIGKEENNAEKAEPKTSTVAKTLEI